MTAGSTSKQKLAIWLAFLAAALSFVAVGMRYSSEGHIDTTPLFGGILMLVLGITGIRRLRSTPPAK
jgi:hypothetical protein